MLTLLNSRKQKSVIIGNSAASKAFFKLMNKSDRDSSFGSPKEQSFGRNFKPLSEKSCASRGTPKYLLRTSGNSTFIGRRATILTTASRNSRRSSSRRH